MQNRTRNGTSIFLVVWTGEFLSLLGSSLSSFGIAAWVFHETQSPAAMASMIFWKYLTQIYLSLFAGHLVDRFSQKITLVFSNIGFIVVSLVLYRTFSDGGPSLPFLYTAMAVMGIFDCLKNLSFQLLTPKLATPHSLARFNGLITVFENLPPVLGPPIAAVALSFVGIQNLILMDAITFVFALLTLLIVPMDIVKPSNMGLKIKNHILSGIHHILRHPELLKIQLFFTIQNFLNGIAGGLVAAFVLTRTQGDESALAIVTSAIGLASVLGGLWQSVFPVRERLLLTIVGLTAVGAASGRIAVGLGFGAIAWGLGLGIRSFINPIVSACNQTYWQERTLAEVQGRVLGARRVLGQGLYPLAVGLGAFLASSFPDLPNTSPGSSLVQIFTGVGILELIYSMGWWVYFRRRTTNSSSEILGAPKFE